MGLVISGPQFGDFAPKYSYMVNYEQNSQRHIIAWEHMFWVTRCGDLAHRATSVREEIRYKSKQDHHHNCDRAARRPHILYSIWFHHLGLCRMIVCCIISQPTNASLNVLY